MTSTGVEGLLPGIDLTVGVNDAADSLDSNGKKKHNHRKNRSDLGHAKEAKKTETVEIKVPVKRSSGPWQDRADCGV